MRESRQYLCYCGLYCKMCSVVNGLPQDATALHSRMQEDGWPYFGSQIYPEFEEFWKILSHLKDYDQISQLCQGGCGNPECQIRICAQEKGVETCALCQDYPCEKLAPLASHYLFLYENGRRIQELGLDAWLQEQDALVAEGVSHKSLIEDWKKKSSK